MTVEEYSKYVINNMHRATLANALNISDKLNKGEFDVNDFIKFCLKHVSDLLSNGSISAEKASRLSVAFYNCGRDYNSQFNYNKFMVLNELIISLWEILNGGSNGH